MIENRELFLRNIKYMLDDNDCSNVSDGDHSFSELYHHRAILTASLFNAHEEKCWKAKLHDTGDIFDGYFIVGVETQNGQATYHYPLEYWDIFAIKEIEKAPKWDGHSAKDAIERIRNEFC